MPLLQTKVVRKRKERIEAAALGVFAKRGYRASTLRQIAHAAGLSTGNIYNYYRSKKELYASLVNNYKHNIAKFQQEQVGALRDPFSPVELNVLGKAVGKMVDENLDYWRLMYVDVIEFSNAHFADTLHDLRGRFKILLGPAVESTRNNPAWNGVDPALAFTMVYLQYFYYFLVERLYKPDRHLGMSDDRAVSAITEFATYAFWGKDKNIAARKMGA